MMTTRIDRKVAAATGWISVGMLLVGQALVINAPTIDDSPAKIRAWAGDHQAMFLVAIYLLSAGFALQLIFWSGLWRRLRPGAAGGGAIGTAALAGVVMLSTLVIGGFAFAAELAFRASSLSDETARMLNDLTFVATNLSDIATALALGGFGTVILVDRLLARWLGWLAIIVAAVHLVAAGAFAHSGFFSPQGIGIFVAPPLFYLWVVLGGLALWRTDDAPD